MHLISLSSIRFVKVKRLPFGKSLRGFFAHGRSFLSEIGQCADGGLRNSFSSSLELSSTKFRRGQSLVADDCTPASYGVARRSAKAPEYGICLWETMRLHCGPC